MNDTMSIARSLEEGMYILREGEYLWRVNEEGEVECTAQGHPRVFELLAFIQHWKTSSGQPQMILHWKISQADRHSPPSPIFPFEPCIRHLLDPSDLGGHLPHEVTLEQGFATQNTFFSDRLVVSSSKMV